MGVSNPEVIYKVRDLAPSYCQYLGALAMVSTAPNKDWETTYSDTLTRIGNDIKQGVTGNSDLKMPHLTPHQVLERFLKCQFGEAVSNRWSVEKRRFDER